MDDEIYGGLMQTREYQQRAIEYLCNTRRGILKAPAGAGKTYITACALSRCLDNRPGKARAKVEIMVNTREQVEQMQSACEREGVGTKCDLLIYCAAGAPLSTNPDLIIVDECHHMSAPSWFAKAMQCTGARWGLSATPFEDKDKDSITLIKEVFTDRIFEIDRAQLVSDGHLSRASVIWHDFDCDGVGDQIEAESEVLIEKRRSKMPWMFKSEEGERKQVNQCRWQAAASIGLYDNEARDWVIISAANQAISEGRHVIILIGKIEHGERLLNAISGAQLCYSGMGAKARREAIGHFKSGVTRCLIATSMLDEGFDAPIADTLILASAGKSARKAIQATGRVLRPFDGKDGGTIHDMSDQFHPMLKRQAAKRRAIYADLKYSQNNQTKY